MIMFLIILKYKTNFNLTTCFFVKKKYFNIFFDKNFFLSFSKKCLFYKYFDKFICRFSIKTIINLIKTIDCQKFKR